MTQALGDDLALLLLGLAAVCALYTLLAPLCDVLDEREDD